MMQQLEQHELQDQKNSSCAEERDLFSIASKSKTNNRTELHSQMSRVKTQDEFN